MITSRTIDYQLGGKPHAGLLVFDDAAPPAATVMVLHAWDGRSADQERFAHRLAALGYAAFAVDLYGKGVSGATPAECEALMTPLLNDRARLRRRLLDSVDVVKALPEVDGARVAAIGFCFGGLCVLDLARAGAPLKGVASFHGLFIPPGLPSVTPIGPKVIAYHGWDDPMAKPEAAVGFGAEFTEGGADWQLLAFGGTLHSFMTEGANNPAMGVMYSAQSAARAWASLEGFLAETIGS